MRLEQFSYLLEISIQKNMTRAAESLHISQPSLSESIKNLESELGVTLLIRNYNGITLTEAGEKTVSAAIHILQQLDILQKELSVLKNKTKQINKNINFETVAFIGNTYFIPFFPICQKEGWNLSVSIHDAKEIINRVIQKKCLAGIILSERDYFANFKNLSHSVSSWDMQRGILKVVIHKKHPLNQYEVIPIQQFLQYPLLFFKNDCIPIRSILKKYGKLNQITESNVYLLPQNFLCNENGVCLSSSVILDYFTNHPFDLDYLVVKDLDITIAVDLFLIMHKDYAQTESGKSLCELILKYFLPVSHNLESEIP